MAARPVTAKAVKRLPRRQFLILVDVKLNAPVEVEDDTGVRQCTDYLQNFGVTATSLKRAMNMVERRITDGKVYFDSDSREIDLTMSDAELVEAFKNPGESGVWYESPRAYLAF